MTATILSDTINGVVEKKILVVEDESGIAENISYALRTEGFTVDCCATGSEAESVLSGGGVDLVVLDVGLPDTNGFDLCARIRKSSDIPIIFLTARSEEVDRIVGLEIGGDDYVVKPFSPRELSARVRAVLRRGDRGGAVQPSGSGIPLEIDVNRKVAVYFGRDLELSRTEFRLLEALASRPGWVFSRDQLMEMAWDEPEASLDRTVDTHIKTVRAKLREVRSDMNPIRTHRGLGYSFQDSW
jgi:two-component system catabolic regulation response regulator CreB